MKSLRIESSKQKSWQSSYTPFFPSFFRWWHCSNQLHLWICPLLCPCAHIIFHPGTSIASWVGPLQFTPYLIAPVNSLKCAWSCQALGWNPNGSVPFRTKLKPLSLDTCSLGSLSFTRARDQKRKRAASWLGDWIWHIPNANTVVTPGSGLRTHQ